MAENLLPSAPLDAVAPEAADAGPPLARRGLVAGGAALAGGAIATLVSAEPAAAGHNTNIAYDSQTVMHLDVTNTTAGSTRVSSNIAGTAAFVGLNNYPVGISRPDGILGRTAYTTSNCAGVAGTCESATGGIGVMGTAKAADGTGVYAYAGSVVPSTVAPGGTGLYASGPSYGVVAVAQSDTATAGLFQGATRVEGPLEAETLTLTRTSGRKKLGKARRQVTIKNVPVTADSVVVASLQRPRRGVFVAAATTDPVAGEVTIVFNKRAPKGTLVGWILVG